MFETNAASEIEYKVCSKSNEEPTQTVCDFGLNENNTTWSRALDLSFKFGISLRN